MSLAVTEIFPLVLETAVRGTPLLVTAWLGSVLLRKRAAAWRHALWTAALGGLLLLPVVMQAVPTWTVPLVSGLELRDRSQESRDPAFSAAAAIAETGTAVESPEQEGTIFRYEAIHWEPLLWLAFWLWATGAAAGVLKLLAGAAAGHAMARSAEPPGSAWRRSYDETVGSCPMERRIRLVKSVRVRSAQTWGIVAPVIAVPVFGCMDAGLRRSILLHELAHIRRLDALWLWIAALATALFWFHPLVWLARQQLRREMEDACDDAVLGAGVSGAHYARHLIRLARMSNGSTVALAFAPDGACSLERRIHFVLDPGRRREVNHRSLAISAFGVVLLLLATAGGSLASGEAGVSPEGPIVEGPLGIRWVEPVRGQLQAIGFRLEGQVSLSADTSAVVGIAAEGRLQIEERSTDGVLRAASVEAGDGLEPEWTWEGEWNTVNGGRRPWLARRLRQLVRRTAVAPPARDDRGQNVAPAPDRDAERQDGPSFHALVRGAAMPPLLAQLRATEPPPTEVTRDLHALVERVALNLWTDLALEVRRDGGVDVATVAGPLESVLPARIIAEVGAAGLRLEPGRLNALESELAAAGHTVATAWATRLQATGGS